MLSNFIVHLKLQCFWFRSVKDTDSKLQTLGRMQTSREESMCKCDVFRSKVH